MVCEEQPTRDCYMGVCDKCTTFAHSLKDEVIRVFNELEIEEVKNMGLFHNSRNHIS